MSDHASAHVTDALEFAHALIVAFGNEHGSMESERGRLVHREVSKALSKIDAVLDATPNASSEARSWQPIATAPKDGLDELLVWCLDTEEAFVAFWSRGIWQYARTATGDRIGCEPDFWMPLPAPPATQNEAE